MKTIYFFLVSLILLPVSIYTQSPPLMKKSKIRFLTEEISGTAAKRNLEYLARHHRMRGSRGFHEAAVFIEKQLKSYGLADAEIKKYKADGVAYYGTQRSRPPWDVEFAELWELKKQGNRWVQHARLASWDAMPVSVAQDSESGKVTAGLVDIGAGTSETDYAGKDLKGKLVLTSSQPGAVVPLAVKQFGAAGIISYAANQRTGWWKENENLVRWGHLSAFSDTPAFAFMVSLKQARAFQERLGRGEDIRLSAEVRAGKHNGFYEVVTATIPGADPGLRKEEIVFSCHLDHQRPGSNDNASGCVAILEVARSLSKLIKEGKIDPPARTIRFVWPPEIEGTMALFEGSPELPGRMKAAIHLDMVGGNPSKTKAIFHVTRGPMSLSSFTYDVAEAFGSFVNRQSDTFASTGRSEYRLHSLEGGKEALQASLVEFSMGSDHQIYSEGSYRIPAIYMNDWPDRYIHTNFDTPANIDPTKLKRAAFIGAASGYYLANLKPKDASSLWQLSKRQAVSRTAIMLKRRDGLSRDEGDNLTRQHLRYERSQVDSMSSFFRIPADVREQAEKFFSDLELLVGGLKPTPRAQAEGRLIFRRNPKIKGPTSVFGYNYFSARYDVQKHGPVRLFGYRGLRGSGGAYAYEVLNLVDGKRNAQEIRDIVAAEFGPVPLGLVVEYLKALESIEMVRTGRVSMIGYQ
ncbi:MAG: M28 family peptidase [Pyrinomonadaceae bacterium]|nr:M28 family peptidase [Pyrinomonadaceae bacterium]